MGNDPRERDGQIVTEREIRLARRFMLAALEDLEDELIALFAVLPHERVDVLCSRRLERLKAIALVDTLDDADDVFAATHVFREEVAHPARGFSTSQLSIPVSGVNGDGRDHGVKRSNGGTERNGGLIGSVQSGDLCCCEPRPTIAENLESRSAGGLQRRPQ